LWEGQSDFWHSLLQYHTVLQLPHLYALVLIQHQLQEWPQLVGPCDGQLVLADMGKKSARGTIECGAPENSSEQDASPATLAAPHGRRPFGHRGPASPFPLCVEAAAKETAQSRNRCAYLMPLISPPPKEKSKVKKRGLATLQRRESAKAIFQQSCIHDQVTYNKLCPRCVYPATIMGPR
jgi:hypothetical protein